MGGGGVGNGGEERGGRWKSGEGRRQTQSELAKSLNNNVQANYDRKQPLSKTVNIHTDRRTSFCFADIKIGFLLW